MQQSRYRVGFHQVCQRSLANAGIILGKSPGCCDTPDTWFKTEGSDGSGHPKPGGLRTKSALYSNSSSTTLTTEYPDNDVKRIYAETILLPKPNSDANRTLDTSTPRTPTDRSR